MALRKKVTIITGASSGIGAAIAEYFAKEGATLSLTGRNKDRLVAIATECQKHSSEEVITTVGDITEENTRRILVQETKEKFNKIDILVNNAGIAKSGSLTELTPQEYDDQMNVNLRTPVFLTALIAPHLVQSKGCVLNISSIASKLPAQHMGVYAITKTGIDMYSKVLARELGPSGVRVNSINAGIIPTPIFDVPEADRKKELLDHFKQCTPINRLGTTDDIAKIAAFLVSDSASFITGENICADGGISLMPGF